MKTDDILLYCGPWGVQLCRVLESELAAVRIEVWRADLRDWYGPLPANLEALDADAGRIEAVLQGLHGAGCAPPDVGAGAGVCRDSLAEHLGGADEDAPAPGPAGDRPPLLAVIEAAGREWEVRPIGYATSYATLEIFAATACGHDCVYIRLDAHGRPRPNQMPRGTCDGATAREVRQALQARLGDEAFRARVLAACWRANAQRHGGAVRVHTQAAEAAWAWVAHCEREERSSRVSTDEDRGRNRIREAGQALYDMLCGFMPDTYVQTDSRMAAWRQVAGEDSDGQPS